MADSFVMLALGDYRFSLSTAAYQSLDRTSEWRWPTVERIGARPAAQFVGEGEDRVTLDGTIFPHYRGGLAQVSFMREEAARGGPLSLIDGNGRVWGEYVITDIREGQTVFFSNGQPRRIDFSISLKAYGG